MQNSWFAFLSQAEIYENEHFQEWHQYKFKNLALHGGNFVDYMNIHILCKVC